MGNPVVHFEIITKDAKKAHEFYSKMFGWKIDASNPMAYGLVDTGVKGSIGGGIAAAQKGQPTHVTFYIAVKNVAETLKNIEKAGGKTLMPETGIPNMVTFGLFADPQGMVVGLVKDEPRPAS
jgi:predicted enzyme related to lactoylglutathione lyase